MKKWGFRKGTARKSGGNGFSEGQVFKPDGFSAGQIFRKTDFQKDRFSAGQNNCFPIKVTAQSPERRLSSYVRSPFLFFIA